MSRPKSYLITGASRGVGRHTAIELSSAGHHVILTARDRKALEETTNQCIGTAEWLDTDLSEPESTLVLRDRLRQNNQPLDGILHNAGQLVNKPFPNQTDEDWMNQITVNLLAPARLTRDLLPCLNNPSHIVMVSSMGGFQGSTKFPGLSAYSATKAAVASLAECLAVELSDLGVHVNALCLGAVQTDMLEEAFPGMQAPVSAREMGIYIAQFLTSGDRFYNGKVLPVALSDPD